MNDFVQQTIQRDTGPDPRFAVIWLHGLGADGHDFEPIVPELQLPPEPSVRFLFPHAPQQAVTVNGGVVMRAWYDIYNIDIARRVDMVGVERSVGLIRDLIKRENARGIDSGRIVLAGFSQGGAIALHAGLTHGESLAGIIALSTYLPDVDVLQSDATAANKATPLFMAHGSYDPVVPFALGDQSHRELQTQGYEVEWHSYPIEHGVNLDEIRDIGAWLRQRLPSR